MIDELLKSVTKTHFESTERILSGAILNFLKLFSLVYFKQFFGVIKWLSTSITEF